MQKGPAGVYQVDPIRLLLALSLLAATSTEAAGFRPEPDAIPRVSLVFMGGR